jgi:hypothetical protein
MYKLDATRLRNADILLTRDKASPTSWLVRARTNSPFSHAILYVGGYSFIDSDLSGVHSNNLQRLIFSRCSDVKVLRLAGDVKEDLLDAICDFARSQVGRPYAIREAARAAGKGGKATLSSSQFCSRLVAQAYRAANVPLGLDVDVDFCVPGDLVRLRGFDQFDDLCVAASAEEVAFAEDKDNPLVWQEEITNRLNADIHRHTGAKVATLEEWVQLALDSAETDVAIAALLTDSGYLDMWRWDVERCPYWYDLAELRIRVPAQDREKLAAARLDDEREHQRRFQTILQLLMPAQARHPRKTIRLLIALHVRLIGLSRHRSGILLGLASE